MWAWFFSLNLTKLWELTEAQLSTVMHSCLSAIPQHINTHSRETGEICGSLPSTVFNAHGIRQNESSSAAGIPTLAEGLVLKLTPGGFVRDSPPLWRPHCSVPHELQEVSAGDKKKVGYWRKLKSWSKSKKKKEVMRAELPSAVCTPESRRTLGTSPRIFQQQSAERQQPCWNFSQLLARAPLLPPPHSSEQSAELALALSSSTMKWQREALKKYSLALYFSRGLSIVLAPTWRRPNRKSISALLHAASPCRRPLPHIPARRSRWPSGTAPAGRSRPPPSADTCWQNWVGKIRTCSIKISDQKLIFFYYLFR